MPALPDTREDLFSCLVALERSGRYDDAIDLVYEHFIDRLAGDAGETEILLLEIEPADLSAEVIVSILIATLPMKNELPGRLRFIERAMGVLEREEEGADEILRGLK